MQRRHRHAHQRIWMVLAGLLPLILLVALALRHTGLDRTSPRDAPPQMLAPAPIVAPK